MSTKTRKQRHQAEASNGVVRMDLTASAAPARQALSAEERLRLIQLRAYDLWEQAGRPGGDEARERFWCEAEKEILASQATAG